MSFTGILKFPETAEILYREGLEIASDHNPTGEQWDYTTSVLEEVNKDEFVTLLGWETA